MRRSTLETDELAALVIMCPLCDAPENEMCSRASDRRHIEEQRGKRLYVNYPTVRTHRLRVNLFLSSDKTLDAEFLTET